MKDLTEAQKQKLKKTHHYADYEQDPNGFWETCDPEFAHLTSGKWRDEHSLLLEGHRKRLHRFKPLLSNFKDLTVIDYGIGDGLAGYVLLKEYGIKQYVGLDISKRTLKVAKENLSDFNNKQVTLKQIPVDFSKYNADVFISVAVIQHFPSKEYLDGFLNNLNKAAIPAVMLHIRNGSEEHFEPEHPALACVTNSEAVMERLPGYELTDASNITTDTGYQYLILNFKN